MLYNLLFPLHNYFPFLNLFKYLTFRAIMAAVTAFVLSLLLGPFVIKKLKEFKIGQVIRGKSESERLHELHSCKQGTPTMGGILILLAIFLSTFLWADMSNKYIWMVLLGSFWLGITGFLDDYLKYTQKSSKGLSSKLKFISQILLGGILGIILYLEPYNTPIVDIPFFKHMVLDLGIFYIFFVVLVITGSSNAVNLTDGLDGLAIGTVVMAAIAFTILCYVSGNVKFSEYLLIPYIKGSGELTVFCASMIGAGLGFLWFNCYPASVFMGDVGALSLGGALGIIALIIKKELLLIIVGGIFVVEALSVILQVLSFKLTGKRIFKCSPLHHHFQFLGWSENKVIVRFWIIASILAMLTLVTLKTR